MQHKLSTNTSLLFLLTLAQLRRKRQRRYCLTTGKKSYAYRTERLVAALKCQQNEAFDLESLSSTSEMEEILSDISKDVTSQKPKRKLFKSAATQVGVVISNKSTSTGNTMKNICESSTQTTFTACTELSNLIDCWDTLSDKLSEANQKKKFFMLLNAIASGNLKTTNLSWKCALDMGVLVNCKTTTNMRYDRDCVEFFSLFSLCLKGVLLMF